MWWVRFTSSFARKGKKGLLKLCKNDAGSCQGMKMLGKTFALSANTFLECEKIICKMYGCPDEADVNECRYILFRTKTGKSQSLPPCQDALKHHTMRVNYQAAVWRRALEANPEVPHPDGYGWVRSEDRIDIDWMFLPPAPEALLELIMCECTGLCTTGHCSCKRNGLSCTDACQCGDKCENPHNVWKGNTDDGDDDGDE